MSEYSLSSFIENANRCFSGGTSPSQIIQAREENRRVITNNGNCENMEDAARAVARSIAGTRTGVAHNDPASDIPNQAYGQALDLMNKRVRSLFRYVKSDDNERVDWVYDGLPEPDQIWQEFKILAANLYDFSKLIARGLNGIGTAYTKSIASYIHNGMPGCRQHRTELASDDI